MDTIGVELVGRRRRRRHSAQVKAAVIGECMRPGVSMAAVALAHNLNANMLLKWVIDAEGKAGATQARASAPQAVGESAPAFVPLTLPSASSAAAGEIQIELHRAGTTVKIAWPAGSAHECAAWLRDLLR